MEIPIAILIILLVICLYFLLIPVSLSLSYNTEGKRSIGRIKLFPFVYRFAFDKEKREAKKKKAVKDKIIKKKQKVGKKKIPVWQVLLYEYDTTIAVTVDFFRFAGRLLKSTERYTLDVSLKGGLGSPDLTGQLFGVLQSVEPMLGKSVRIAYQPDFLSESINVKGNVTAGVRIRTYNILKEVLIFIWELPKLKIIKIVRRLKKRRL